MVIDLFGKNAHGWEKVEMPLITRWLAQERMIAEERAVAN